MLLKKLQHCQEITAGDNSILREVLHPSKDDVNIRYSLAHAIVKPGQTSLPHKLKTTEVYYILAGEGIMYINDESHTVRTNQAIYIPPHARQYIQNTGRADLKFLCLVDPAWMAEDEVLV